MFIYMCVRMHVRVSASTCVCVSNTYIAELRCFEFPGSIHLTLMSLWDELSPVQPQPCSTLIKLMACLQCNHFLLMCVCDTASVQSSLSSILGQ